MSDDLELLIDDPNDIPNTVKPEEEKKAPAVDDGIATLKQQLAQSKQREEQLARRADQAVAEVDHARAAVVGTQYQAVTGALAQRQDRLVSLKEELKNATAVGDADRVADLTEAMTDLKIDMRHLEEGKRTLEQRAQQAQNQPRQRQEEADDGLSASARDWISRNPESVKNPKDNARMMRGHWSALEAGLEADTPEYFEHLDGVYKGKSAPERGRVADEDAAPRPAERSQARYAAPVERDAGPRKVQLRITPEMREAAQMADMTIEEYAKEYVKVHGVR